MENLQKNSSKTIDAAMAYTRLEKLSKASFRNAKGEVLKLKDFSCEMEINDYKDEDIFKEHLMLNLW